MPTCRFTLRQGQILVLRDCPRVLFRAGRVRRMLLGAGDRGIDADPPVNFPGRIRLGQQPAQHPVPGAVPGVATVALPPRPPRTEHLPRQVTPGNPGPIPADDSLRHLAVVAERVAPPTRVRRQQRLDPLPLLITQPAKPRPSPRHPSRPPPATSQIWEARSSSPVRLAHSAASSPGGRPDAWPTGGCVRACPRLSGGQARRQPHSPDARAVTPCQPLRKPRTSLSL